MTFHTEIAFILSGLAIYTAGAIWILALALKRSFWWVLGCFLFPPVAFLFIIFYWPSTKFALVLKLCGSALMIAGVLGLRFLK